MKERPPASEIREKIIYHSEEIIRLTKLLKRNSPIRKAPKSSKSMTYEIAKEIRKIFKENPNMGYKEIANICGVNQGRVSEVLQCRKGW